MSDAKDNAPKETSTKLHVAAGATVAVIGMTLGLTAPFVFLKTPLPYMATPAHKIKRALSSLPNQKGTFVDLGSGDGEAIYQAYRAGFSRVVGYELNWTLWAVSQMRRFFFWGPQARECTQIYCQDLFASPLPTDTTAVMVFGVTPLMKPISMKLARETKPGVHVLSYRFPIPIQDTESKSSEDLLQAKLVYDHEEMRIYEVIGDGQSNR
jgi:hypothetical protein